jgi:hypothetical protein
MGLSYSSQFSMRTTDSVVDASETYYEEIFMSEVTKYQDQMKLLLKISENFITLKKIILYEPKSDIHVEKKRINSFYQYWFIKKQKQIRIYDLFKDKFKTLSFQDRVLSDMNEIFFLSDKESFYLYNSNIINPCVYLFVMHQKIEDSFENELFYETELISQFTCNKIDRIENILELKGHILIIGHEEALLYNENQKFIKKFELFDHFKPSSGLAQSTISGNFFFHFDQKENVLFSIKENKIHKIFPNSMVAISNDGSMVASYLKNFCGTKICRFSNLKTPFKEFSLFFKVKNMIFSSGGDFLLILSEIENQQLLIGYSIENSTFAFALELENEPIQSFHTSENSILIEYKDKLVIYQLNVPSKNKKYKFSESLRLFNIKFNFI